jgi:zinc D-Ala-D-Ala carboxypeptidase
MSVDWGRYPNFLREEFTCRCGCGRNEMKPEFLERLQALRSVYGKPMAVTSGYRCPQHPKEAAKAQPGMHTTGLAADIGISGAEAVTLLRLALDAGFRGVGVHQKGSGRFLHVDLRETPTIWSY